MARFALYLLGCAIAFAARPLIALRYSITLKGFDQVAKAGTRGILLLPNHNALVDPVIIMAWLFPRFRLRPLADEYQVGRTALGRVVTVFGTYILPNMDRRGPAARDGMKKAVESLIEGLRSGESILLYPAGRIKRQLIEDLGSASGVEAIVKALPDVRIVLVRHDGLWGSAFGWAAKGRMPSFGTVLIDGVKFILMNGIFFTPRRHVTIECVEPTDFPRQADRSTMNRYMEAFYNAKISPNTYVPYRFWESGGRQVRPEPVQALPQADASPVAVATRGLVLAHLAEMSGRQDLELTHALARDAGLDSLAIAELVTWIQTEFGFSVGTPESLRTVGDVVLAAAGRGTSAAAAEFKPVASNWFGNANDHTLLRLPPGATLIEAFLAQAAARPRQPIVADQKSGIRTYRDLVTAIFVLKPIIEKLPGEYVGIMMPASVGAVVLTLATMASGKTPVMINWTTGVRTIRHSLDSLGVRTVLSARELVTKLAGLGIDLAPLQDRFLYVEDVLKSVRTLDKLLAAVRSYTSPAALGKVPPREVAVVLFTSGSESLPKAVPLTHANLLTNISDVLTVGRLQERDVLMGLLPPFHSFGLTITLLLPLCVGMRTTYHANPTEAALLARQIAAYRATLMIATPTFLAGIVGAAGPGQLDSLRLAVTGAERCPDQLYATLRARVPGAVILEGYGITECSPVVSATPLDSPIPGSIGRLLASVEGVVVSLDETRRAAPDETGMLLVRGPSIFGGYLHYSGASPFVAFEGRAWYRTGDLVTATADGIIYFKGRLKRFVKLGGEMISLPAIESVLQPHFTDRADEGPTIAVEALGNPDSPDIVLFTRTAADRSHVNAIIKESGLSALHNIRQVVHVDAIPVLGTGKTDYRTLIERYS
jgi:acyl-CoA synthetase (AMP-forming)/AMP-acid ligase II/acyl carrier protein